MVDMTPKVASVSSNYTGRDFVIAPRYLAISSRAPLIILVIINYLLLYIVNRPYLFLTKKQHNFTFYQKTNRLRYSFVLFVCRCPFNTLLTRYSITYFVFPRHPPSPLPLN